VANIGWCQLATSYASFGHLHPHRLRHTFAVMYVRHGRNLEFLRRTMGHSSILTTPKIFAVFGARGFGGRPQFSVALGTTINRASISAVRARSCCSGGAFSRTSRIVDCRLFMVGYHCWRGEYVPCSRCRFDVQMVDSVGRWYSSLVLLLVLCPTEKPPEVTFHFLHTPRHKRQPSGLVNPVHKLLLVWRHPACRRFHLFNGRNRPPGNTPRTSLTPGA
jgi:hypothetical protein